MMFVVVMNTVGAATSTKSSTPQAGTPVWQMGLQQSPNIALMHAEEEVTYDPHLYNIEAVVFLDKVQGNGTESRE
jgi:hypothetical protein